MNRGVQEIGGCFVCHVCRARNFGCIPDELFCLGTSVVGNAILEYSKMDRPEASDRSLFF